MSLQPNVPGRGIIASYGPRFWGLVAAIGLASGLAAAGFVELLRFVEHLAWDVHHDHLLAAVKRTGDAHRVAALALAGVVAGVGGLALRRLGGSGGGEISEAIWCRDSRLELPSSLVRGVVSIVTVGLGSSLGREAAPQLAGAAAASRLATRCRVPAWQRRLLVACGAGAGFGAIYNVPLGGALFALEVLLGTVTIPLVLPALAATTIATATAWIVVARHPTYAIPAYALSGREIVLAAIVGPLAGLVGAAWIRLIVLANDRRPRGRGRAVAPVVVMAALGTAAIAYPELLGNGLDVTQAALLGQLSVGVVAAVFVLKPLATAACLGSGAPGGLFTPTLALGALLGALVGHPFSDLWPGTPLGAYALIGAAAVLAACTQAPVAALVLVLELTGHAEGMVVPLLVAIVPATAITRVLRLPSIYSARIAVPEAEQVAPAAPPI